MNIIRIECPSCQQSVELPEADARRGLNCPSCFKFFTPSLPPITAPAVTLRQQAILNAARGLLTSAEKIHRRAETFCIVSCLCAGIGLLVLILGMLTGTVAAMILGGSLISLALWLYLAAQIIHIRANTEK
jgi:hypothetical protein